MTTKLSITGLGANKSSDLGRLTMPFQGFLKCYGLPNTVSVDRSRQYWYVRRKRLYKKSQIYLTTGGLETVTVINEQRRDQFRRVAGCAGERSGLERTDWVPEGSWSSLPAGGGGSR